MHHRNKSLTEIYLGSNQIESTGCVAIADAVKINTGLQKLDLQVHFFFVFFFPSELNFMQESNLGGSGALALADALRTNTTLKELIVELDRLAPDEVQCALIY
jgi:hypothetical protein